MRPVTGIPALLMVWTLFVAASPSTLLDPSRLTMPQIKYRGARFAPVPGAVEGLLAQVARRTSIEVNREPLALEVTDPDLFKYPSIYMGGDSSFQPFTAEELKILRQYLSYGGFLLIDDNSGRADSGFDRSVRSMVAQLFPHTPLQKIPRDHSLFRSFYLINSVVGRVVVRPYLEGISIKGRTVLVYNMNDLAGAWARNSLGQWNYEVIAGGETQRQWSIRLGVNIVMYALTLDYKKDMVHLPIILERLRKYHTP